MSDYGTTARTTGFFHHHRIVVSGQGDQTVVLANGYGTDQLFWRALLPWLEGRFRVVRFDWAIDPVHFESARYQSLDDYAEDLLAVISATDAAPCILIGHSMSAMVAMVAARREPRFFKHMVMLAPAPRYVSAPGYQAGFDEAAVDDLLAKMGDDYMAWISEFAPIAVGAGNGGAAVGEFVRSLRSMRPDVALAMGSLIFKMDLRDQLDGFAIPTTIIQPTDDPAVPVTVGRYLASRWPHARLEIIEAAGHFPHLTAPDQVLSVLTRVLTPAQGS